MLADGVIESSSTTGTSTYELVGAVGAARTWAQDFADGAEVLFWAQSPDRTKWEYGIGILTWGPPRTLTRATILKSSNAGAKIDWQPTDQYLVYSIASADALAGLMKGSLAEGSRPWWVRTGGRWLDYAAGLAVSWVDKLATGAVTDVRVGRYDVVKDAYFADGRRPWTAVGGANKTVAAADIAGVFTFDNAAASRTLMLPAHGDAGVGHGFRVGGLGLTAGGQYGIVLTPAAGDGIEGGADAATKTIPGGVRFDAVWDQASDTWRIEYLNAPITGPRRAIEGLTYANGSDATNDIDIADGGCWDSAGAYWMQLAAITKQLDATWAAGTNQGGRFSGSLADGDFNIWAIGRPDTGRVDVGLETTASVTPTLPTNYTYYRKIGWFRRASGAIVAFHTYEVEGGGIEFAWDTLAIDVTTTIGTSRSLVSLDRVPDGIKVQANISLENNTQNALNVCCPDQADVAPATGGGIGVAGTGISLSSGAQVINTVTTKQQLRVRTNTSKEVAMRASGAGVQVYASVISFEWPRR